MRVDEHWVESSSIGAANGGSAIYRSINPDMGGYHLCLLRKSKVYWRLVYGHTCRYQ
jgi:hypothetical protein